MNSGAPGSRIALTDEQLQEVEKFASIGFSPRKIAVALGIPGNLAHIFVTEAEQEGTPVNQHFLKGVYKTEAEARLNIASSAKSSIFAYQEMKKSLLESEVDELKRKLEPIPEELLAQKVIVISNNARDFGYEPISKSDLLARINQYEVDNLHKKRLARDAGITDIDFEQ